MMNIKRTLITVAVVTLAFVSVPATAEAKTKEYKATTSSTSYDLGVDSKAIDKKGQATFINGGQLDLIANPKTTIYYEYKTGTTKVASVKTPSIKSKKIKAKKYKSFKIAKNAVVKFKVVKGKATKSTVKKAKTYYFVCNYKKVNFMQAQPSAVVVSKNGQSVKIAYNKQACDMIEYTCNGKRRTVDSYSLSGSLSFSITAPTTIQVTGYKMGKKLGTYTYNYDVKKYNNPELSYKLAGNYSDPNYLVTRVNMPYASGFSVAYTLDGTTPSLKNGTFIETLTEENSVIPLATEGKVTFKAQLYKKVYYKNTSNKYVFAEYEPYNGVTTNVYRSYKYVNTNIDTITENFPDGTNFTDTYCPETYDGLYVTFIDYKGYLRTIYLNPGERVSDYYKYGPVRFLAENVVVDGVAQYDEKDASVFLQRIDEYEQKWMASKGIAPFTAEDYAKSFTDNPTRLTPAQTYSDLQSHVLSWEEKAGNPLTKWVYDENGAADYEVWLDDVPSVVTPDVPSNVTQDVPVE